jgi:RHS repeat-associated protein
LRAADYRVSAGTEETYLAKTFEEYWYDALGRRVLVRARRDCYNLGLTQTGECNLDKVRRTIWDGDRELGEIQARDGGTWDPENDGQLAAMAMDNTGPATYDPNPFFGRVVYAYGPAVDQPLSVIRIGYGDRLNANGTEVGYLMASPFAMFPLWTSRGQAEFGTYADGSVQKCYGTGNPPHCVRVYWPGQWFVLEQPKIQRNAWHGTLIEDKRDDAGTLYRRNRYVDANTGQFTQEDPIGLAGGLNAYSFGDGDAVNGKDPSGLTVCAKNDEIKWAISRAVNARIEWDADGCVSDMSHVHFYGRQNRLQNAFRFMVEMQRWWPGWKPWQVNFDDSAGRMASSTNVDKHEIYLYPGDIGHTFYFGHSNGCGYHVFSYWDSEHAYFDLSGLVAHEIGHVAGLAERGKAYDDHAEHREVFKVENEYHTRPTIHQLPDCYGPRPEQIWH